MCSSTHSSSTLYGVEWSTSRLDLHPGKESSKLGASQRRCGRFGVDNILLCLPAFDWPSPALPRLAGPTDRPTDRLPFTLRARQATSPVMFALPQLHALLTCELSTMPADREASRTFYWSIHRQFSPSASPFLSYRLDPVISVSVSVGFFSAFLRKPSV